MGTLATCMGPLLKHTRQNGNLGLITMVETYFRFIHLHSWCFLYIFIKNRPDINSLISSSAFYISTVSNWFKTKAHTFEVCEEFKFYFYQGKLPKCAWTGRTILTGWCKIKVLFFFFYRGEFGWNNGTVLTHGFGNIFMFVQWMVSCAEGLY